MVAENKMGTMPVGKLIVQMSLPMMISMFVQALYNIVDSVFVARIGEKALTAVSLAFPVQNLMIAVCVGTAVGINALLSMRLGEKKQDEVNLAAGNGIFLAICSYVVFLILGLTTTNFYFSSQTTDAEIIKYGTDYLTICLTASLGVFCGVTFDRLLQSTGRTFFAMISQLTGAICNIILDPILIFGLFGFPKLGIKGAAIATVIGQFAGLIVSIIANLKMNHDISFSLKMVKPKLRIIKNIYKVGFPSILLSSIGSVMTYGINLILASFTTTAVALFGVYFKLQSFIFMPVFGLNNGLVPIMAYNYGAKQKTRITKTVKFGLIGALSIMLIGTLIFQLFPKYLLLLFDASPEMLSMGIPALRIISIHFPIAAFCIILISFFQALGHGFHSMITSFVRQLIVLLPAAWLLSLTGNVNNVWWAFPIAEIASLVVCIFMFISIYKKQIKNL